MASQYVVPSNDVQIYVKIGDLPAVKIDTGTTLNLTFSQTVQDIFAISHADPIDNVGLNSQYMGQLSFQSGEYQLILDAINGALPPTIAPYATFHQIPPFTLSKTSFLRNAAIPKTVTESILNCRIENTSSDTNRNEAETLTSLSVRGTSLSRTVAPIA